MVGTLRRRLAVVVLGGAVVVGGCADSMSDGAMSGGDKVMKDGGMMKKEGMAGDKGMSPEKR